MWVAVGAGGNSAAYSYDGVTWLSSLNGNTVLSKGLGVAWNGNQWITAGSGSTSMGWSNNGITWYPSINGSTIFTAYGSGVAWNGALWVATGSGTNSISYSYNGYSWFGLTSTMFTQGSKVAYNYRRPYQLIFPSTSTLAIVSSISGVTIPLSTLSSSRVDIVGESYYNEGFTNLSVIMKMRTF